ncbi:MAG: type II toxin-antitoxin system HicB family antitoxin [Bacteroidetes bacterium]|nr:type II toxin-antitoxin system HicB family antitoxin [Bacteroidota bacterium]
MSKVIKKISYPVIYEACDEGGYIAYVPALPGCRTQGESFEETERNISEAIELYLEALRVIKSPIPLPKSIYQGRIETAI